MFKTTGIIISLIYYTLCVEFDLELVLCLAPVHSLLLSLPRSSSSIAHKTVLRQSSLHWRVLKGITKRSHQYIPCRVLLPLPPFFQFFSFSWHCWPHRHRFRIEPLLYSTRLLKGSDDEGGRWYLKCTQTEMNSFFKGSRSKLALWASGESSSRAHDPLLIVDKRDETNWRWRWVALPFYSITKCPDDHPIMRPFPCSIIKIKRLICSPSAYFPYICVGVIWWSIFRGN